MEGHGNKEAEKIMLIKEEIQTTNKKEQQDAGLLTFLLECINSGEQYRNKFKTVWDEIEGQIRCDPPDAWGSKEDWQTKIYIPLQSKKDEIATSYLKKMIFGKCRFFDVLGTEKEDRDDAQQLADLIDDILEIGKFRSENDFIFNEGISLGTGFIKLVMDKNSGNLKFIWRSCYNVLIDPDCGHRLDKARFIIDVYKKDIAYIVAQAKKGGMYEKGYDEVSRFFNDAKLEVDELTKKAGQQSSITQEGMVTVKGIDGTTDMVIPQKYKMVDVHECWVEVPGKDGLYEEKVITVLNQRYILRNEENIFGFKPFEGCRIKPRKYDYYGKGYLENGRGLQELSNSLVNLGFDSAKISAMDIIILDEKKVSDNTSIKYKPLAIWKMKDINGVRIQRQPMSAISDVIRGLTLIDQIDQEASGVTRQTQGVPNLSGTGTTGDTLGEYELKMQAIDQRFLDVGRFVENDYIVPLIKKIFKIITNPKLFSQDKVNRLIGMKEVDDLQSVDEQDPQTGEVQTITKVVGTKKVVKLDLAKISKKEEMAYNFKAIGVTMLSGQLEMIAKLKEGLMAALANPTLTAMTKIDILWKRIWQVAEIDDYEDFLRTKDEVRELLTQQTDAMPDGMPPGQSQGSIPGMPPQMPPQGGM